MNTYVQIIACVLVGSMSLLPLSPMIVRAEEVQPVPVESGSADQGGVSLAPSEKHKPAPADTELNDSESDDSNAAKSEEKSLSTMGKVGIAAGAIAVVGVAAALGGGGSGGSSSDASAASVPPTMEQLVSAWNATASSVENFSYTGFYHLYANGASGYDLVFYDGSRKVGSGQWTIDGYRLTIYNDTGTVYSGEFAPGNINSIRLNTTVGWTLDLSR